jgi:hypothetical protein
MEAATITDQPIPVQNIMGAQDIPAEGLHLVRSPSKGVLQIDVKHGDDAAKIVVSSPYYEGSTAFMVRGAGTMVEILQDSHRAEHGWRAFRSLSEFFENPAGLRLDFFAFAIRKPGVPEYDSRN